MFGCYDVSSPAVSEGLVFIWSSDKHFYAFNQTTGEIIWKHNIEGSFCSSPVVADGMVFIYSWDKNVYAFNATTGAKIWNYTTGGKAGYSDHTPAVADGVVFITGQDIDRTPTKLYALNETTGALIWSKGTFYRPPIVVNGVVLICSSNGVCAMNQTTGAVIWKHAIVQGGGDCIVFTPAFADGLVLVGWEWSRHCIYDKEWMSRICALNATTGELMWSYKTRGLTGVSSPAVADGMVYIGSWDHKVYALNASSGALIWSYTTGLPIRSSPAVADGVVYVSSWDGRLYAFGELPPHYVVIKSVKSSPTTVMAGLPVSITVVVKNEGTEPETFTVTPYYQWRETIAIGTKTVTNLAPGASLALKFSWNTMGVAAKEVSFVFSYYRQIPTDFPVNIKVVASTLTGEPINTLGGEVRISFRPLYVAAGIAIVAIVAIVIYYKRKRILAVAGRLAAKWRSGEVDWQRVSQ